MLIVAISILYNMLIKDPNNAAIKEATSHVFGLRTPIAKALIELILLLVLIGIAGYLYDDGPKSVRIPTGIFLAMATFVGLFLFFRVLMKMREE